MGNSQPDKKMICGLPVTLYHRTVEFIRDYDRMVEERENIPTNTQSNHDKGRGIGDRTGNAAVRIAAISEDISAIDKAIKAIPEEYRTGVWESVVYGRAYPYDADRNTYYRWKKRFIYRVAVNKRWVE